MDTHSCAFNQHFLILYGQNNILFIYTFFVCDAYTSAYNTLEETLHWLTYLETEAASEPGYD